MVSRNGEEKKSSGKSEEAWTREGRSRKKKKDLQLYKIHKPVKYKDTTEEQ